MKFPRSDVTTRDQRAWSLLESEPSQQGPLRWRLGAATASIFALLLFLLIAPLFPLSYGWLYFPLSDSELIPYRDYFNPVAPLTFFTAQLAATTPDPYLAFTVGFLPLAPAFGFAIYWLATRYAAPWIGLAVSIMSSSILAALRLEALGGWNMQTIVYHTLWVTLLGAAWLQVVVSSNGGALRLGRIRALGVASGVVLAASILVKQTNLIVDFGVILSFALWILLSGSRSLRHGMFVMFASLTVGLAVPLIAVGAWLQRNAALGPFIEQMASGGGKNPQLLDLASMLKGYVLESLWMTPAVLIPVLVLALAQPLGRHDLARGTPRAIASVAVITGLGVLLVFTYYNVGSAGSEGLTLGLAAVAGAVVFVALKFFGQWKSRQWTAVLVSGIFIFCLFVLYLVEGGVKNWETATPFYSFWVFLILSGFVGVAFLARKAQLPLIRSLCEVGARSNMGSRISAEGLQGLLVLVSLSGLWFLVNFAAAPGPLQPILFLPFLPFLVAVGIQAFGLRDVLIPFKLAVVAIVIVSSSAAVMGTVARPYAWFNWTEPAISLPRTTVDVTYMRSIPLAPRVGQFYSELQDMLSRSEDFVDLRTPNGTQSEPTVFAFPTAPAALALTTVEPYKGIKCYFLWFDFCPNEVIATDLDSFHSDRPSIVVWMDIPEQLIELNEAGFVQGRSALRDWMEYKRARISNGEWLLVGEIPVTPESPNAWPVEVFVTRAYS